MRIRSTINGREPRTLRDARHDPYDWFETSPRPDTPAEQMAGLVLAIVIGITGADALVHWWVS